MIVGFCVLHGRIAPRFDQSQGIEVVAFDTQGGVISREHYGTSHLERLEICRFVGSLGVKALVCGGLMDSCERFFHERDIRVIDNVIGDLELAIACFARAELRAGAILD